MQPVIETRELSRRFGKVDAVDGLTLHIPAGSLFAFVEPNGAGKTTTIKMLLNLLLPTSGQAIVLGTDSRSEQQDGAIRRLLGVKHLVDFNSERLEPAIVMCARTPEIRQLGVQRAAYAGRFQVSLMRHDIEAVVPLRRGAAVRIGAYQLGLDRIARYPSLISALARESGSRSVFERRPRAWLRYYLRNPATLEAVRGSHRELRNDSTLLRLLPFTVGVSTEDGESSGFRAFAVELGFPTASGEQQSIAFDDTWLERGEIVIVRSTESGSVERRIDVPDFPVPAE